MNHHARSAVRRRIATMGLHSAIDLFRHVAASSIKQNDREQNEINANCAIDKKIFSIRILREGCESDVKARVQLSRLIHIQEGLIRQRVFNILCQISYHLTHPPHSPQRKSKISEKLFILALFKLQLIFKNFIAWTFLSASLALLLQAALNSNRTESPLNN